MYFIEDDQWSLLDWLLSILYGHVRENQETVYTANFLAPPVLM